MTLNARKTRTTKRRPATRRDLFQQLESRQLMAGFNAAFDFRATYSGAESGYTADVGKSFAWQNQMQYGWNWDNQSNMRNRAASGDKESFAYIGGSAASTWEVAVPNGQYEVKILAGDSAEVGSNYGIAAEGTTVVKATPTWNTKWAEGTARVWVSDGRLTVTSASGSWNNKIDSVKITAVDANSTTGSTATPSSWAAPVAPGWVSSWSWNNSVGLNWQDSSWDESGFIIERSTDGTNFNEVGRVAGNITSFSAGNLNGWTRYYFRVKSYNSAGSSAAVGTNVLTGNQTLPVTDSSTTTGGSTWTPAPSVPSWASATAGTNSAYLAWGDVANEQGYIVQRSTDGWNFSEVGRVGANVTTWSNTGLASNTKYYYRIQPYNAGGTSNSTVVNATTPAAWVAPAAVSVPAAPTWLSGAASGSTSVNLVWGDTSNETGFIIEKSTDSWSWSEAGRVSANVTSYMAQGLTAGTKYVFRVKPFNSAGTGNASPLAYATTSAATASNSGSWNSGSSSSSGSTSTAGMNKSAVMGMVPNQVSASTAIPMLQQLGAKQVRLWYSIGSWGDTSVNSWDIAAAKQYKAAGFTVVMDVNNANVPDYNTAKALYTRLANSELRNYVDYWEIGNEPNMYQYWYGSLQQFVQNNMRPAYEAFHAVGEPVIGGAISWDVNACKQLQSFGYSNYCDYSGFHPYGESGAIVAQRAADAKAAFGNKPMIITEWNVQGISDPTRWAQEITIGATKLSNIAVQNYYYALLVDWSHVGNGGTFYSNGSRNTPFFNAIYSWMH